MYEFSFLFEEETAEGPCAFPQRSSGKDEGAGC
jgi:hypothetical protein